MAKKMSPRSELNISKAFKDSKFFFGDVVWAKVKGYPHWPARIDCVRLSQCTRRNQADEPVDEKTMWPIFFYGTHEHLWMTESDLESFVPNRQKFFKGSAGKIFLGSINEMLNDPLVEFQFGKMDNNTVVDWLNGEIERSVTAWDALGEEKITKDNARKKRKKEEKAEEEEELNKSFENDPVVKNYANAMYKIDDMKAGDFIGANYDKAFYGIITTKNSEDGIHVQFFNRKKFGTDTYIIKKKDEDWINYKRQGYIFFHCSAGDVENTLEGKTEAIRLLVHDHDSVDIEWQRWQIKNMELHGEDTTAATKEYHNRVSKRKRRQTRIKSIDDQIKDQPIKRKKSADKSATKTSNPDFPVVPKLEELSNDDSKTIAPQTNIEMVSVKEDEVENQAKELKTIAEENIPDEILEDEPSEKTNSEEVAGQKDVDEAQDARAEEVTDEKMEKAHPFGQNEEKPLEEQQESLNTFQASDLSLLEREVKTDSDSTGVPPVESEIMEEETNIAIDNNSLKSESKDDDDLPLGENRAPAEIQMDVDQEMKEFMDNCKSEPAEDEGYNQNNGMTTIGSIDLLAMSTDDDSPGDPDPEYFASLGKPRVAEKPSTPSQSDSQISQSSIPSQSDSQVSQSSIPSLEEIPEMDLDL